MILIAAPELEQQERKEISLADSCAAQKREK
jgi:hypothetical protein